MAIAGVTLTALAAWAPRGLTGTAIVGPRWLLVLLPLFMGAPLAFRRRAPILMWIALLAVVAVQYGITGHPPQGLEWFVPIAGAYSLGAHANLRRTSVGLGLGVAMTLAARSGLSIIPLLVSCGVGVFVQARNRATSLVGQNAVLQRQPEQATSEERARIARELHDIVAHHLSVIVLQAAGARASGNAADAALAKIENSGRQALVETRRLLGVLREPSEPAGLAPQPGIDELDALVASVRAAGLPVRLVISGDHAAVPAAVDVSVYRIVQEALTNVLKHADHACADVTIDCDNEAITIEISDDGTTKSSQLTRADGHGLAGMRERVAIFGGDFRVGPRPSGGFAVQARLPLDDSGLQSGPS